jgi:hypothetical protein
MGGLTSAITRVVDSTGHTAPAAMFKAVHVVMGFQHAVGGPDNAQMVGKACMVTTVAGVVAAAARILL